MANEGSILKEEAVLGGGCFWCLEAIYERVKGVLAVESGYAGGITKNPTYEQVCSGNTGHAEVVRITFDPAVISYREIIDLFWRVHDPTTLNRQGADTGTQYRSIILFADEKQESSARQSLEEARGAFRQPIVTEIRPLEIFYPAEKYHQDYFANNPYGGYCRAVIAPKVQKLEKELGDMLQ
ncbi:MAG: peptide-methionine (S)-S-oxide reductase MsrA [Spirochaetales bacterium]|nr:peptide-methionine (S)-S-oxide reductase MsrA [Spirochaetales bacterium]